MNPRGSVSTRLDSSFQGRAENCASKPVCPIGERVSNGSAGWMARTRATEALMVAPKIAVDVGQAKPSDATKTSTAQLVVMHLPEQLVAVRQGADQRPDARKCPAFANTRPRVPAIPDE